MRLALMVLLVLLAALAQTVSTEDGGQTAHQAAMVAGTGSFTSMDENRVPANASDNGEETVYSLLIE
jgi:hypothetical protein